MACPYFSPEQRCDAELWQHRVRLPLGDGFCGSCTAPGHEGQRPSESELQSLCNLGYAGKCFRMPADRQVDSVRFAVTSDKGMLISLQYVCERDYLPAANGVLNYDCESRRVEGDCDESIRRLALFFALSHLSRYPRSISAAR